MCYSGAGVKRWSMWASGAVRWGGGSHGGNYLIRTGIQPRTKATSCFGYYQLVPLPTPAKESERCQMGIPPGKMPVSPDRRLLVFLAG